MIIVGYRFVQYNPTSLERNYKHDVLTENDLGVPIDLINSDTYAIDPTGNFIECLYLKHTFSEGSHLRIGFMIIATLDPADERLLEEDISQPNDSKR